MLSLLCPHRVAPLRRTPTANRVARGVLGLIVVALLGVSPASAWAGSTTSTSAEINLNSWVNAMEETDETSTSNSGGANSTSSQSLAITYQEHSVASTAQVRKNTATANVALATLRTHTLNMNGIQHSQDDHWVSAKTIMTGSAFFSDQIAFSAPGMTSVATASFYFRLNNHWQVDLVTGPNERPLFRLSDRLLFTASGTNALGNEVASSWAFDDYPIFDPDFFWSVLEGGRTMDELIPVTPGIVTLQLSIQNDFPSVITFDVMGETEHRFLNDGPEASWSVTGDIRHDFFSSADLLGVLIQDASGAVVTDVQIQSQEGVNYTILGAPVPEPSGFVLAALAVASLTAGALRGRRKAATLVDRP